MSVIGIIFYGVLAVVAVATAIAMLVNRNAIYSALFLVLNFATVAMLYFSLGAPFIALTQITVYAGAIMVLFLFVITLLGAERLPGYEPIKGQRVAALLLAGVFVVEVVLFLIFRSQTAGAIPLISPDFASPQNIGVELFTKYILPFEMVGFILLSATIGAIILTKQEKKSSVELPQGKE